MNAEVKGLPELHVTYVRHVGSYSRVGGAWKRIMCWIIEKCEPARAS